MKIALIGNSLLIAKSLELYLRDYLTSYKMCDFVVATEPMEVDKPVFLVGDFLGANLNKPFTKEMLLEKLESFYLQINHQDSLEQKDSLNLPKGISGFKDAEERLDKQNDTELQVKIRGVLERYTQEIVSLTIEHFRVKNG